MKLLYPWQQPLFRSYSHFMDEETGSEKLSNEVELGIAQHLCQFWLQVMSFG